MYLGAPYAFNDVVQLSKKKKVYVFYHFVKRIERMTNTMQKKYLVLGYMYSDFYSFFG
jgi:hypothetical protein